VDDSPVLGALCRGLADHVRKFYGDRAVTRRSRRRISARAPDGAWRVRLDVAADRLEISLWPTDERFALDAVDPLMFDRLDAALGRCAAPLARWTLPAVKDLIAKYFVGSNAHRFSEGDFIVIHPAGQNRRVLVCLTRDRVEVRHGMCGAGEVRKDVDLEGDFAAVRERLLAAIEPLPEL
jgi:hypothetical protein